MDSLIMKDIQAAQRQVRLDFKTFARLAFRVINPGVDFVDNWHIDCICEHLEAMWRMEIPRLIINMPPRSLKSFLVSQALPAWVLGLDPSDKFINVSYGMDVAEQNAINCRAIIKSDMYKLMFPDFKMSDFDRNLHFKTDQRGHYYANTALSPITGIGCNWMIIDDPIKPQDALSATVRNSTNENIRSTLLNRYDDRSIARLLLIMQRLHVDDPTGNLAKDQGIVLLKLPAETKTYIEVKLYRPECGPLKEHMFKWQYPADSLLFPKRLSRAVLDQVRMDMTEYHYAGQFLQEPVPIGGGEFKDNWVQYYDGGDIRPSQMNVVILVDPAGGEELNKKKKKSSDWSAFMVVGLAQDNNYYLLDVIRDRFNPTERIDTLFMLHRKWNSLTRKAPKVGYEKYGMMSDIHYINIKKKQETYHFPLIQLGGAMIKEERIRRLIPDLQQGRWYFPANLIYVDSEGRRFDLVSEIVNTEMASFPRAKYDDMLDALSRVYDPELGMVFPRLHVKSDVNILRQGGNDKNKGDSWLDF